jgi:putative Mg2+ transporter-C (MgtC) family protein
MITLAFMQQFSQWVHDVMQGLDWPTEVFIRLMLASFCGGLAGLEREVRGRQAGFRTYMLVALGAALTMIVSLSIAIQPWQPTTNPRININVDPGRIAYGVMTGIGFLGAGVIIQHKGSIRGLTTAASLWCIAAVGLAAGFGLYLTSIFSTLLIVAALWLLDYLEDVIPRQRYRTVTVRTAWEPRCISRTISHFRDNGFSVVDASFQRSSDLLYADVDLHIAFSNARKYFDFEATLAEETNDYQLLAAKEV